MDQIYTPKQNYKLLVRCYTYNQSKYIEDALNGFAMQKTSFPFVCLVVDDCSTDGEQDVIKAWMERECDMTKAEYVEIELANIILVPHKVNENCNFSVYLLKKNLYGNPQKRKLIKPWQEHCDYEALCEGDDYWIADDKLQKQNDFLDITPLCSMVFHSAKVESDQEKLKAPCAQLQKIENRNYLGTELFAKWTVPTASVMLRKEVLKSSVLQESLNNPNFVFGDILIFLSAAACGEVWGMSDTMCIYRRHDGGASVGLGSNRQLKLAYHYLEIWKHFGEQYKNDAIDKYVQTKTTLYVLNMIKIIKKDSNHVSVHLNTLFFEYPYLTVKFLMRAIYIHMILNPLKKRICMQS